LIYLKKGDQMRRKKRKFILHILEVFFKSEGLPLLFLQMTFFITEALFQG